MQLRSEARGALTGLALIATLMLAAVSIDFGLPGQALLQSVRFHIAGALLVGMLLLWLFGSRWRALLFLCVAIGSAAEGGLFIYRLQTARAEAAQGAHTPFMTLLSFNVLASNEENGEAIADFIAGSGADVVFIMEARPLFPYLGRLATVYPARFGCNRQASCDLMMLSKTSLAGAAFHDLGSTWHNRLITAATEIGGRKVSLAAVHMVKPYFDSASVYEARNLQRAINGIEGPLVLAGDFNAAPWSDNIEWLARTSRLSAGAWYPATWPVALGPLGVPIDNVFVRDGLLVDTLDALPDSIGSNHRGLRAVISRAE